MSDVQNQDQVVEKQDQGTDYAAELSAMEARIRENFKNELAGLNRRNSELEKMLNEKDQAVEEVKTSKMTELEKMQQMLEQERAERQKFQRETLVEKNRSLASSYLLENQVPTGFADFLNLGDTEALPNQLEKIKELAEGMRTEMEKKFKTSNGSAAPKTGNSAPGQDLSKMSISEKMQYLKDNPDEANRIYGEKYK